MRPDSMRAISSCLRIGVELLDAGHGRALREMLGDAPVMGAARGDLRRMCYDENLQARAQALQPVADRCRNGAADAAVDLVEDQGRDRGGAGENQLQGQHEARQLAARGDAGERAERRAGHGGDLEMDALAAMLAPFGFGERGQHRAEARLVEPQWLEFRRHPGIEPARGSLARPRHRFGGRDKAAACLGGGAGQMVDALGAFLDGGEPRRHPRAQPRQLGDRHLVLAGERPQREEPLLDFFELARVELETTRRGFQRSERFGRLGGGALGRGERRIKEPLGALAGPLQAPRGTGERRLRTGLAAQLADCLGQGFGQPLGVLQQAAAGGKTILLTLLGCERLELREMMAEQVLFVPARRRQAHRFLLAPPRLAPVVPSLRQRREVGRMLGEGVEDHAMIGRIEEPALLELTLDLDEAVAELAQQAHARRLVIDKGAAAAVGREQAAQHNRLAGAVMPGFAQDRMGRMVLSDRKLGRNSRLLRPGAHQAGLGPPAERQAERVQQDRLARTGLAGQHAQSRAKGERQTIDQHDVADGQTEQHCADDTDSVLPCSTGN